MVTMETADNALKTFYLDAVTEAFDKKVNPFLAQIQKTSANVVGKEVKKLVKLGFNGGISAGSETGALPNASSEDRIALTATLKNLYGTIEISDKALRASANDEGAFVNLLNDEMQGLMKSANFNFGRMLFGDGTAKIAALSGVISDGNVVSIMNDYGIIEGVYVDIVSVDGKTVLAENYKITQYDRNNKKIRLVGAQDLSEVLSGPANVFLRGSMNNEITGLGAIFKAGGSIYGVDKTSVPAMTPYLQAGVVELTENVVQKAIDKIEENSGSQINMIICSWGVKRKLMEYYRSAGVTPPEITLEGGFKGISFNGIPLVVDRFCPFGTMYLLNTNDFKLHQLCDWKWLEGEDGKVLKQIPGKPVYTATLVKYAELMCERPCGQGIISGIAEA